MSDTGQNSRSSALIATAIVMVALSGVVVVIRFLTRIKILRFLGGEDWCIGFAFLLSIGNSIGMTYQARYALGRHLATLSADQISACLKAYYATVICYGLSLTLTKLSILLQYLRIFKVQKLLITCYILMAFVVLYGLEVVITSAFPCWPIASFWNFQIKGKCIWGPPLWFTNVSLNIATDLMIFLLPIPVIYGLNLPKRQKTALLVVFLLGFFVCVISILRLPSLEKAAVSTDFTYDNIGIAIWSCVELNVAILCACLPTLKPLISRFFPGLLSTAKSASRSNYPRYGSSGAVTTGGTRTRTNSSKVGPNVRNRTIEDSESGTGIVAEEEDVVLDELSLRNDSAKGDVHYLEPMARPCESSGRSSENKDWMR